MYTIELFISFYKTNLWARSSDWESAALARQRPRVQIPVGPSYFTIFYVQLVF